MIDKVIILGVRRANQLIPDHEIGQMVGRCGRSYTESGEATLVVPEKDLGTANEYMFGKPKPIASSMFEVENTAFHCTPAIYYGEIYNQETFEKWYSRTLSFVQGKKISWREVREFLLQVECVKETDDFACLTDMGEISFRFYYPPDRIYWLKDKLRLIVNSGIIKEPEAISWLLAYQHCSIGEAKADELSEYKSAVNSLGLYFHCGELTEGYAYYCMLSRRKPKWLKHKIEELKEEDVEMIVLPGGLPGATNLDAHAGLDKLIMNFAAAGKPLAAICAAPMVYGKRGLLKGKKATCYPGFDKYLDGAEYTGNMVEVVDNFVLGKGPAAAAMFGFALLEKLAGAAKAQEVKNGMLFA